MWWHGVGAGAAGGWWIVFPILWLLLLGGLIFVLVWAVRSLPAGHRHEEPIDVLRRRLAAGEISQDEYQATLKVLKG